MGLLGVWMTGESGRSKRRQQITGPKLRKQFLPLAPSPGGEGWGEGACKAGAASGAPTWVAVAGFGRGAACRALVYCLAPPFEKGGWGGYPCEIKPNPLLNSNP
jgi:hypothetical protein